MSRHHEGRLSQETLDNYRFAVLLDRAQTLLPQRDSPEDILKVKVQKPVEGFGKCQREK